MPYILVREAKGYKLYKYADNRLKAFIIKDGEHAFRGSTVNAYKAFFTLTGVTLHE